MTVIILDLVSERSERRVSGILGNYIGCVISKAHLDFFDPLTGTFRHLPNRLGHGSP